MRIPVILFIALSLLLTAWSQAAPPVPLRMGVCLSLTGAMSANGETYLRAVELWSRQANDRGGILGRKVEIVPIDDRSDPKRLLQGYKDLAEGKADFLLGPQSYDSATDVVEFVFKARIPCVFPMPLPNMAWEKSAGYSFGLLSPLSDWPSGFFELLSKTGGTQVALLAVNHPQGQTVLANAEKWAKRYGVTPVFSKVCSVESLSSALAEAKLTGAKAIGIWTCKKIIDQAAKAVREAKLSPRSVFFSTSMGPDTLPDHPARDVEGMFTAVPWDIKSAKAYPGGEQFVEQYRKLSGQDPDWLSASVYAACQVYEAAFANAASLDRDKVRSALSRLDTLTIVGRYGVDPSGMQLRQIPLIMQWQKGKREIVWPEEMRTAKPIFRGD